MTVAACILDCLAKEVRDHSKTHRGLIVIRTTHLSLRDLCQQDDRVEGVGLWQRSWQSQNWELRENYGIYTMVELCGGLSV